MLSEYSANLTIHTFSEINYTSRADNTAVNSSDIQIDPEEFIFPASISSTIRQHRKK